MVIEPFSTHTLVLFDLMYENSGYQLLTLQLLRDKLTQVRLASDSSSHGSSSLHDRAIPIYLCLMAAPYQARMLAPQCYDADSCWVSVRQLTTMTQSIPKDTDAARLQHC
jgi:hypothetical protein